MHVIGDGVSSTLEAFFLLLLYVLYVAFVVGVYCCFKKRNSTSNTGGELLSTDYEDVELPLVNDNAEITPQTYPVSVVMSERLRPQFCEFSQQQQVQHLPSDTQEPHIVFDGEPINPLHQMEITSQSENVSASNMGTVERVYNFLLRPITAIFLHTIPGIRPTASLTCDGPHSEGMRITVSDRYSQCLGRRFPHSESPSSHCAHFNSGAQCVIGISRASLCKSLCCIAVCIGYICLLSMLIVFASDTIVIHLGLSQTTVGATLVALGSQVDVACILILQYI